MKNSTLVLFLPDAQLTHNIIPGLLHFRRESEDWSGHELRSFDSYRIQENGEESRGLVPVIQLVFLNYIYCRKYSPIALLILISCS
jgi:hypothetical protein